MEKFSKTDNDCGIEPLLDQCFSFILNSYQEINWNDYGMVFNTFSPFLMLITLFIILLPWSSLRRKFKNCIPLVNTEIIKGHKANKIKHSKNGDRKKFKNKDSTSFHKTYAKHMEQQIRKQKFINSYGYLYGYKSSPKGHIDTWRSREYPYLIPPIPLMSEESRNKNEEFQTIKEQITITEPEVYLDYAGAALPSKSQLYNTFIAMYNNDNKNMNDIDALSVLANPHSSGPAANRTSRMIQKAQKLVLDHFGCEPHFHSNFDVCPVTNFNTASTAEKYKSHPGYEILFTSGTTQALQIVASCFPWYNNGNDNKNSNQPRSTLLYSKNVHTSVIGMRGPAMNKGAQFKCIPLHELCNATPENFKKWQSGSYNPNFEEDDDYTTTDQKTLDTKQKSSDYNRNAKNINNNAAKTGDVPHSSQSSLELTSTIYSDMIHHLLVIPAECNFSGDRSDTQSILSKIHSYNNMDKNDIRYQTKRGFDNDKREKKKKGRRKYYQHKWHTMLDIAKLSATSPVDLCSLNPDFACISFYKLFGHPTGLGALFVKRSCIPMLTKATTRSTATTQPIMSIPPSLPSSSNRITIGNDNESMEPRTREIKSKININTDNRYFGGGSVDVVLPNVDFMVPRNSGWTLDSLKHGTCHYRGIVSLVQGFQELSQVGGMKMISAHSTCLAMELVKRLQNLRHANGKSMVVVYGGWKEVVLTKDTIDMNWGKGLVPGPTVSFNIKRHDGTFVGCSEVAKLASLNKPCIQFRTGCFCNPGACQDALELSDQQIQENYSVGGHVCGDQKDIINGLPTGAVRISFGKDSLWEDLDAVILFLKRYFLNESLSLFNSSTASPKPLTSENIIQSSSDSYYRKQLSEIYVFPIKSCAAFRTNKWKINRRTGRLAYDREFALVDSSGTAMRLQSHPKMSAIHPEIDLGKKILTIKAPKCSDLILSLESDNDNFVSCKAQTDSCSIMVCGNRCGGRLWGDRYVSQWFTSFLGVKCYLARYDKNKEQYSTMQQNNMIETALEVKGKDEINKRDKIAFANDAPLLLISQESVDILNSVLMSQNQNLVNSQQFRPNFVVHNGSHYTRCNNEKLCSDTYHNPEDEWTSVLFEEHDLKLSVAGPCSRCAMVDVDPKSGMKGKTLRALADYRRRNGQINFGIFLCGMESNIDGFGEDEWIQEGDVLVVS